MSQRPVILLSGMGIDTRVHDRLTPTVPVTTLPWLPFHPAQDLPAYARGYAERGLVRDGDLIGGTSMGGMVALEIARHVRVRGVIQIASCDHPRHINPVLRRLWLLSQVAPVGWLHALPDVPMLPAEARLAVDLARDSSPAMVRWACRTIVHWRGCAPDVPVRTIHGTRDHVIRLGSRRVDERVLGAGHIMVLTHPAPISAFIDRCARELGLP